MTIPIEVWLRGTDFATTTSIEAIERAPREWTDADVRQLLEEMLKTMHRLKHKTEAEPVALRGLSWIVNPYEEGGVVVAIEITLGAAVAGPFDIDKGPLEAMISRVLVRPSVQPSSSVH
jgi:hypothetical protein